MGGGGDRSSYSTSGKEDGDAKWMVAINLVISSEVHASNGTSHQQKDENPKLKGLEHYKIKTGRLQKKLLLWRKILHQKMLEFGFPELLFVA